MVNEGGAPRQGGLVRTVTAVFWSFFGVRKGRDYEADARDLNPVHLIIAAIVGAAIFVGVLVFVVHLVVQ